MKKAKFEKLTVSELSKVTGGAIFTSDNTHTSGSDYSYGGNDGCWTSTKSGDTADMHQLKDCW